MAIIKERGELYEEQFSWRKNLKSHLRYFKGFNNCYIWL